MQHILPALRQLCWALRHAAAVRSILLHFDTNQIWRQSNQSFFFNATHIDPEVLEIIFDGLFGAKFDLTISIFP
jgi:hypothetical protein